MGAGRGVPGGAWNSASSVGVVVGLGLERGGARVGAPANGCFKKVQQYQELGRGAPEKLSEYAGWYFRVYAGVCILRMESSTCRWVGWVPTRRAPETFTWGLGGGGGLGAPFPAPSPPPGERAPRAGSLFFHIFHAYLKSPIPPPRKGPHATRARHQRQAFSLKNIEPHKITTFWHVPAFSGDGNGVGWGGGGCAL